MSYQVMVLFSETEPQGATFHSQLKCTDRNVFYSKLRFML